MNTLLSKQIASKFEAAGGHLKGVNPKLASFLNSSMASTLAGLQELPATMGYLRDSGRVFGRVSGFWVLLMPHQQEAQQQACWAGSRVVRCID